jgi:hypothetical protein
MLQSRCTAEVSGVGCAFEVAEPIAQVGDLRPEMSCSLGLALLVACSLIVEIGDRAGELGTPQLATARLGGRLVPGKG